MDISQTTAPKSDQQNYEDYIAGPKTVTIADVRPGPDEQPVEVHLVEFPGRPYKPNKTARRILVSAWGPDSTAYIGRRMTLFGDPDVRYGGAAVGGIRISQLSHIPKRMTLALTETRGKRKVHTIEPLPNVAPTTLARMPEESTDRIEALMAQLGLDEGKEKSATLYATNKRTDDWAALELDEAARLIRFLESKLPENGPQS